MNIGLFIKYYVYLYIYIYIYMMAYMTIVKETIQLRLIYLKFHFNNCINLFYC